MTVGFGEKLALIFRDPNYLSHATYGSLLRSSVSSGNAEVNRYCLFPSRVHSLGIKESVGEIHLNLLAAGKSCFCSGTKQGTRNKKDMGPGARHAEVKSWFCHSLAG